MECNPLAFDLEQNDISGETLNQILEEVRSLKENFERADEENKNLLKELKEEVQNLRSAIKEMKMYADPQFKLLPNMPFNTLEELKEFDKKLPQDDSLRTELKAFLQRLASQDYASFLRSALRVLVTDELAVNLTWRGTIEKPSVQAFTVFFIIRDLCHARYSNVNHAEINRICQQHFLHAKDRVNKRLKTSGFYSGSTNPLKFKSPPSSPLPSPPPLSLREQLVLPEFPLTTLAALEEFDEKLLGDSKSRVLLKKYVNNINGRVFSIFLRAAFRALITDDVAMEMTWRGTKEKPSIQDFKIYEVITDACSKKFEDATKSEIKRICQQHFLHAKDRVIKRVRPYSIRKQ